MLHEKLAYRHTQTGVQTYTDWRTGYAAWKTGVQTYTDWRTEYAAWKTGVQTYTIGRRTCYTVDWRTKIHDIYTGWRTVTIVRKKSSLFSFFAPWPLVWSPWVVLWTAPFVCLFLRVFLWQTRQSPNVCVCNRFPTLSFRRTVIGHTASCAPTSGISVYRVCHVTEITMAESNFEIGILGRYQGIR